MLSTVSVAVDSLQRSPMRCAGHRTPDAIRFKSVPGVRIASKRCLRGCFSRHGSYPSSPTLLGHLPRVSA